MPPNVISTIPLLCELDVGITWQSAHCIGLADQSFLLTCAMCAPTARSVVRVSPLVPLGGATFTLGSAPAMPTRVASPWHVEHAAWGGAAPAQKPTKLACIHASNA